MLILVDDSSPADDPANYDRLPPSERACLDAWIAQAIRPARRVYRAATSYGLKHQFSEGAGIYVTNGAFKGAMRAAGHPPVDATRQNWLFRVTLARWRGARPSPQQRPEYPCVGCGQARWRWLPDWQRWLCPVCDLWADQYPQPAPGRRTKGSPV